MKARALCMAVTARWTCPTKHYGFQSQRNPAVTNTSSIPLVKSITNARPRAGSGAIEGYNYLGLYRDLQAIYLGPLPEASAPLHPGPTPLPLSPPSSPTPPEPHTHPATRLPPPGPAGPLSSARLELRPVAGRTGASGARQRRADRSRGHRAHLHRVAEPLAHSVVEGLHMRPRQFLQRWLLLLPRDPIRRVS